MTEEELKNKCKERAKIFQQAMESCKSSSPMDCIEWFADRIAELEKENAELRNNGFSVSAMTEQQLKVALEKGEQLEKKIAELKEKLKPENCLKSLAKSGFVKFTCENGNEHDQLTKAKEIIKDLLSCLYSVEYDRVSDLEEAEQFLSEVEK